MCTLYFFVRSPLHFSLCSSSPPFSPFSPLSLPSLTIFDLPPFSQPLFTVSPLILSPKSPSLPSLLPPLPSPILFFFARLLPLLHWPGRSASLSSSPPPPPASACGPSHPGASSRPPLASSAPPPTSAAEPAPPSPGSVGRGDRGTDGEERGEKQQSGGEQRRGQYVNLRQILQYKVNDCQKRLVRIQVPIQGFVKYIP